MKIWADEPAFSRNIFKPPKDLERSRTVLVEVQRPESRSKSSFGESPKARVPIQDQFWRVQRPESRSKSSFGESPKARVPIQSVPRLGVLKNSSGAIPEAREPPKCYDDDQKRLFNGLQKEVPVCVKKFT